MRYDPTEHCKADKTYYNVYSNGMLVRSFKTEQSACKWVENKIEGHIAKLKRACGILRYEYIIEEVHKTTTVYHRRMYSA